MESLELDSTKLGALPLINHFFDRADLPRILNRYLPVGDSRSRLSAAAAVRLVVANLLVGRSPLYALGQWIHPYDPSLFALSAEQLAGVNDDRVGRALEALFDADRASMLTELMLAVIGQFNIDTGELHNDSTSVSVHGDYASADGAVVRGKPTPAIKHGHSKDHRPDLKQLVWILTVAADGAVPITYRLADGNTSDDPTHIPTWNQLAALLGKADFLYVADSKLASAKAMNHIDAHGGRFITVLPKKRKDVTAFNDWAQTNTPAWVPADEPPGVRAAEPEQVYSVFTPNWPSASGHRIVWVHSTAKAIRDHAYRQARIQAGLAAIEALGDKLTGPKPRLRNRVDIEKRAGALLKQARAARWVTYRIEEHVTEQTRQAAAGRPGPATRYTTTTKTSYTISADINFEHLAYDANTDGCFPLISNDTDLTDQQVLAAYRYQPNLERRHHLLKSVQDANPVLLHNPARIEALFCCQFLALLIAALIEREIRNNMAKAQTAAIPLYPEWRACPAPSTERILEIFAELTRHQLRDQAQVVQAFEIELTELQTQTLNLLGVPTTDYTPAGEPEK